MERKLILEFDKKQKQQKKSKHHHHGHKDSTRNKDKRPKLDKELATPSTSSSSATLYRDRAKERREGINKDFDLDPDDLIVSNPIIDGGQQVDEAELRRQQIEESKYFGGDVEHTHLVKGLDFALYEKMKNAQKQAEKEEANSRVSSRRYADRDLILAGSDSDEEEFTREAIRAATASMTNKRQIDLEKLRESEMITCRTALARKILDALDEEKKMTKCELFMPGRMSYILSLDEEIDTQVTTIVRSKAEQAETEEPVSEKELAFDQLIKIFARIRNKKQQVH